VLWDFGNGVNETTSGGNATYSYAYGGHYLVYAKATVHYQASFIASATKVVTNSMSLFSVQIEQNVSTSDASDIAIPSLSFVSTTPGSPLFNVGQSVSLFGGYLEAPANSNWTISSYSWNFANGQVSTVAANQTTGLPLDNVSTTYSASGLYPVSLALKTEGPDSASLAVVTYQTIVIVSPTASFGVLHASGGVSNPGTITSVEIVPGGPYSFDPQVDDEANIGFEVIMNIYQTLVAYKGSQTDSFIPEVAAALPSVQNGGIGNNGMVYNFSIRSGQYFSNGDPVTPYTVWFSLVRDMAFTGGSPGTPGWLLGQYVIPGVQNGTGTVYGNNTWSAVTSAFTYNSHSDTVAIKFNRPMTPTLAFQILSDPLGSAIVDASYAFSVGAGFGEGNWTSYMSMGTEGSYNTAMQWSPVGSGPFKIENYIPDQSIELIPNPKYTGVPGIPPSNESVVIDWVKNADTGLLMFQDGQADSISFLPNSDFPTLQSMQSRGLANIYSYPSFEEWYYSFNINISKSIEASQFGSGFNEPSNYFADLPTRLLFVDTFPYAGYFNDLLGNAKYKATFGVGYQGIIPPGMVYAPSPSLLGGLPQQNLKDAEGNFSLSAWHDQHVTVPLIVYTSDSIDLAAAEDWAVALSQISGGNITAKPIQIPIEEQIADLVPANAMGVYWDNWAPDYPDPSDYVWGMYATAGDYGPANNWANFSSLAPPGPNDMVNVNGTKYPQAEVFQWLQGNITLGDTSITPAVRQQAYLVCDRLAIDLGLYVYVNDQQAFWFWRSWLTGATNEENPMLNAAGNLLYSYVSK
jgi:ABC-type transport system substrate-binding protein